MAQVSFVTKTSAAKIGKNDLLEVSYEVQNGEIGQLNAPAFKDWQVVGGPNMSSSSLIINGQRSSRTAYQYILKPLKTGSLSIPGAVASIGGTSKTSNAVTVEVSNKSTGGSTISPTQGYGIFPEDLLEPAPAPQEEEMDGYILREGENLQQKIKDNLFLRVNISKKSCYEGESLVATYLLYSRVSLDGQVTRRPSFSGFSSLDMADPSGGQPELVKMNGKTFRVYTVRKVQLYPLQSGRQTLEPVEIDAQVQFRKIPSPANMHQYDPYSPDNVLQTAYTLKSDVVAVDVIPLPSNKPEHFTGAVGRFEVKASLEPSQLALQQAGKLRVEISGQGNWAMVQPPVINWPKGVEVYEPVMNEDLDSQSIPLTGKRVYEYSFSSANAGRLEIKPGGVPYFDPWKKAWQTAVPAPVSVEILNKRLPTVAASEAAGGGFHITDIFTDAVAIIFPLLALGLVVYLALKNRRKKMPFATDPRWSDKYQVGMLEPDTKPWSVHKGTGTIEQPVSAEDTVAPATDVAEETPALHEDDKWLPQGITHTTLNENMDMSGFVTAKEFYAAAKANLHLLLQKKYKVQSLAPHHIQDALQKSGIADQTTEELLNFLDSCDSYIYSPLHGSEDWQAAAKQFSTLRGKLA